MNRQSISNINWPKKKPVIFGRTDFDQKPMQVYIDVKNLEINKRIDIMK